MASGDTLATFGPLANEPPAASYSTLDTRNSHPTLDYDDTAVEAAVFSFVVPRNYGGNGITVYLHWAATTAVTGNVVWQTSFEDFGPSQDTDSDGFATAVTWAAAACSGTSGVFTVSNQPHTNGAQIDSVVVGDACRIKIERVGSSGSDTMVGDAELMAVELKET